MSPNANTFVNVRKGSIVLVKQLLILEATKRRFRAHIRRSPIQEPSPQDIQGDPDGMRTRHIKIFSHGNEHRRRSGEGCDQQEFISGGLHGKQGINSSKGNGIDRVTELLSS